MPFLVSLCLVMDQPMTFLFQLPLAAVVAMSVLVMLYMVWDGKTNSCGGVLWLVL